MSRVALACQPARLAMRAHAYGRCTALCTSTQLADCKQGLLYAWQRQLWGICRLWLREQERTATPRTPTTLGKLNSCFTETATLASTCDISSRVHGSPVPANIDQLAVSRIDHVGAHRSHWQACRNTWSKPQSYNAGAAVPKSYRRCMMQLPSTFTTAYVTSLLLVNGTIETYCVTDTWSKPLQTDPPTRTPVPHFRRRHDVTINTAA